MKKSLFISIILFAAVLLASCASSAKGKITKCEPKDNESVLLCGIVQAEGMGYTSYMGEVTVNGLHTKGIELEIKDLNTNKIINVKTEKNGFFYYPKAIAGHRYQLMTVTIRDSRGSYSTWIPFEMQDKIKPSLCRRKQATVMTNLRINYRKDSYWNWYDSGDAERVKNIFKMIYTGSDWANFDFSY